MLMGEAQRGLEVLRLIKFLGVHKISSIEIHGK